MNGTPTSEWKLAFSSSAFVIQLTCTLISLVVLAFMIDDFFAYVQSVKGTTLNDPVLNMIPAEDMSVVIFTCIYGALIAGLIFLLRSPRLLLIAAEAYVSITIMRMVTLLLFPLEPDSNMVTLNDPFVDRLFYDEQAVTKDLFFSGHVSVLVMMTLVSDNFYLKRLLGTVALIVGISLLIQHAHYTIDVVAAPVFAWIGVFIAGLIAPRQALPN